MFHKRSATSSPFSYGAMLNFCSAFLASGLTVPVAVSACASALRKVCEDLPNLSHESTNIAGLLRIGEVVVVHEQFFMRCRSSVLAVGDAVWIAPGLVQIYEPERLVMFCNDHDG